MRIFISDHYIENESVIVNSAVKLMKEIQSFGDYQALIVGGVPRDIFLQHHISDVDIATNCPLKTITENFNTYDVGKGKNFGVVIVIYDNFHFEVAQFRSDGKYSDNRHPDNIKTTNTFYTDSSRRDFTCNAMGITCEGKLVDYHGGASDIKKRIIRSVGDPYKRFSEDCLRMIRMARFMAVTGFKTDAKTRMAARRCSKLIETVAKERIRMEFVKAAKNGGPCFARFIDNLRYLHLLPKILPEVSTLQYFTHKMSHHPEGKTVYDHVLKAVAVARSNDPVVLMAILLHDVGKAKTMTEVNGYPQYIKHDIVGAHMVKKIGQRLCFPKHEIEAMVFATKEHMRFHSIKKMKPSKIVKMVTHQYWPVLKEVGYADEFCRGDNFKFAGMFDKQIAEAEEIKRKWGKYTKTTKTRLVNGTTIINVTGENPGPIIGQLKELVHNRIINENIDHTCYKVVRRLIMEEYEKILLRK